VSGEPDERAVSGEPEERAVSGEPDESAVEGPAVDAVVVGAGFAGLYMLHRLRQQGFTARGFEAGGGVGGTWYWNRYPGARCDIDSMQYSFQFSEELQQEWRWTERYASQPELLSYIEHVADRFELRRDITFNTMVEQATFSDDTHLWTVNTINRQGQRESVVARFFLLGSGVLSTANVPAFEGRDEYRGQTFHTGRWPHDGVDFSGKRVGVVGTGSSGIQSIPLIAEEADHLHVFQRTANYVVPAQNRPLDDDEVESIKADYTGFRARAKERPAAFLFPFNPTSALAVTDEERRQQFDAQWEIGGLPFLGSFGDLLLDADSNRLVIDYWQTRVRDVIDDPAVSDLLIPNGDIFGGKRLCAGTDYYETYNRPDVTLVDSSGGIDRFTPAGIVVAGVEYELDVVVFATGFDAMTGSVVAMDIAGPTGTTIKEAWSGGAGAYIGMAINGFPNLFNTQGPGGPGVFVTMVTGIEHQGDWIVDCMSWMRDNGYSRIEATIEAQVAWQDEVDRAAEPSLRSKCDSWYSGANIPGKHRKFMPYIGGFPAYAGKCSEVEQGSYLGFDLTKAS
jgi:cation diffusion facilitator CzcD-associated flavoprotein CzcO